MKKELIHFAILSPANRNLDGFRKVAFPLSVRLFFAEKSPYPACVAEDSFAWYKTTPTKQGLIQSYVMSGSKMGKKWSLVLVYTWSFMLNIDAWVCTDCHDLVGMLSPVSDGWTWRASTIQRLMAATGWAQGRADRREREQKSSQILEKRNFRVHSGGGGGSFPAWAGTGSFSQMRFTIKYIQTFSRKLRGPVTHSRTNHWRMNFGMSSQTAAENF